ncbi:GbsR/MarR family transcriptional regulator [Mammaliicoccus fleurettii]|uniref:HTH-type transcriptional regulator n=1 Tax=Mammaliicoccus fleurettii TaxID=150056 RepID=A0ABS5MPZ1_9STAP|nr:GbsR/MarR family transcriptional regulator [Mammaliicoccus fleurettii]HCN60407.1 GbsR/MarR family transcriptional regulator [Staphylococcus sp.]MBL0847972.1 GbsR/MarR family transcriptional regulator [Mammaliicoccus fleurettii]MBO3061473.1 GbsR/MarR family transcriptional regulator [Mammaliicoccus fleurettii]MBS3672730.1 GbsR/MarR family transcriptional regulator [Mammaliicoccus fleurettii]MBS3697706.1 GbsR/MarR family transcriptional regulator [Mammaliicoccus fleurettii]
MVRSDNYKKQLDQAKDIVINGIGETMDLYGINRSVGNLYGTMVFEGSMTLDEMREQLQMSKPSMSAGVKKLQEFDIVKQQFTRGSRKQHFIAEKDFFIFFNNFFSRKWDREISINMDSVKDAEVLLKKVIEADGVDEDTKEEATIIYKQLEDYKVYYEWLSNISSAIKTGEIYKYFPIPEREDK